MRHQQNRLGDMLHIFNGEAWLIGIDQRDVVLPGNVSVIGGDETAARLRRRLTIFPRGIVERIVAPYNMPKLRSSMYFAAPVTLASPSLRRTFVPTARPTMELSTDYTDYTDWSAARKTRAGRQAPGFAGVGTNMTTGRNESEDDDRRLISAGRHVRAAAEGRSRPARASKSVKSVEKQLTSPAWPSLRWSDPAQ